MDDGGGVRAGCIRLRRPSPRRIMSRWFSSKAKKTAMAEGRVRDFDAAGIRNFSEDSHGVDSPPRTTNSEVQRREHLFSIGVSCYLLHLIATAKDEIHKIVELRNDLEKFLVSRNDELRQKQQQFVELRNDLDKFLERHNDELRQKQKESHFRKQQERSETSVDGPEYSIDHYLKHDLFKGEMDQLEAELEAEFELLQIGQDQEGKCSKLKEVANKSEDSKGLRFGHMMCLGPVEKQQGVCPYELERRLHEVMETRQEEKIKELQIELEDAKQKLYLMEVEASLWKDTVYIVSSSQL